MTKASRIPKLLLPVLLAVVMLAGLLLLPKPVETQAATAGIYNVVITLEVTNDGNLDENYAGFNKEQNDSAGISIGYKENNGTGSTQKYHNLDIKTKMSKKGTYTLNANLSGFPTLLYLYIDDNSATGDTAARITKLTVEGQDVWQGVIHCDSTNNTYAASIDINGTKKTDYFDTNSKYCYVKGSGWADKKPYPKTIFLEGASNPTVPTSGRMDLKYNTFARDQYSVNWYQDPTIVMSTTSGSTTAATIPGVSFSSSGTYATVTIDNSAKDWVLGDNKATSRKFYLTAYIGSYKKSNTITLENYTLQINFYNMDHKDTIGATASGYKVDYAHYGTAADIPEIDKCSHYISDAWYTAVSGGKKVDLSRITSNMKVYCQWKPRDYTVTYKFFDGTTATKTFAYGTALTQVQKDAPANSTQPKWDENNHFTYSWPAFSQVTGNATYQELQNAEAHSYGSYSSLANSTHSRSCKTCGYVQTLACSDADQNGFCDHCRQFVGISGTCGTCTWEITAEGHLTIAPTNGVSGQMKYNYSGFPWVTHSSNIYRVNIKPGVTAPLLCDNMFNSLVNVQEIDLTNLSFTDRPNMSGMFANCNSLKKVTFGDGNVNPYDTTNMFLRCSILETIHFGKGWNTTSLRYSNSMFTSTKSLKTIEFAGTCTQWAENCTTNLSYPVAVTILDKSSHYDKDDHICDICGDTASTCADNDRDHSCDICGTVLTECHDLDKNHLCDICGTQISDHIYVSACDRKCDYCNADNHNAIDHVNENRDLLCDLCNGSLMYTHSQGISIAGLITIDDISLDVNTRTLTIYTDTYLEITTEGNATDWSIVIAKDVDADICLKDVSISTLRKGIAPVLIEDGTGQVTITLEGAIRLTAADDNAAIQKDGTTSSLEIRGTGTLIAYGGKHSAAIGGSYHQDCSNILISGGAIYAYSGTNAAAIGGGSSGNAQNITITGGTVYAYGGANAAAIGGGSNGGNASGITISGGYVNATGGTFAPGIGAGNQGHADNILISGGSVTAKGNGTYPGIGAVDEDRTGQIIISGGSVKTLNGSYCSFRPVILDEQGTPLYLLTLSNPNNQPIYINGAAVNIRQHSQDNSDVYLYVPGEFTQALIGGTTLKFDFVDGTFQPHEHINQDAQYGSHECDVCGAKVNCFDEFGLHMCSTCGAFLTELCRDEDGNKHCDVCWDMMENGLLKGYTVTLGGSIGVNFYVMVPWRVMVDSNAYMLFTLPNGETQKVYVEDTSWDETDAAIRIFTCYVDVKEMTDTIQAQLITSYGNSDEFTYCVEDYAKYIIANPVTYGQEAVELAKALLHYGASAQLKFGYRTDALANRSLAEPMGTVAPEVLAGYKKVVGTAIEGVKYVASSTVWESETTIRHYFTVGEGITFTLNGQVLTPVKSGQWYYVEIENIVAKDMPTSYVLEISNGTDTQTITYSTYSYFYDILLGDYTQETKDAVQAAYCYSQAALAYFAAQNP